MQRPLRSQRLCEEYISIATKLRCTMPYAHKRPFGGLVKYPHCVIIEATLNQLQGEEGIMNTQNCRAKSDHWSELGREFLDSYLVQSFENPCINPQSVLMRSFLIDRLFPNRFNQTIDKEIYYSA